ncbi:hypothetical protein C6P40_000163 [Pichia californica]|uniref:Uncharacterized protein n=1 Tax=Pichia californica TaxID=460514 RepID=A0A9P6WL04_9ASCO|nr:hypothetical protein C6P40_000163 [[Candida] californica]
MRQFTGLRLSSSFPISKCKPNYNLFKFINISTTQTQRFYTIRSNSQLKIPYNDKYNNLKFINSLILIRNFHSSNKKNAEFWKVGTNIKIFKGMLKESGSSQWKYRVVLFLVLFTIMNFLFNVMLTILTNIYLDRLQPSCWQFGFSVNTEIKHGLVNEYIKLQENLANENYFKALKDLAKDNGILYNIDDKIDDITKIILNINELDIWFNKKNNLNYISIYCDLLLRYALTCDEYKHKEVEIVINKAFDLINHYELITGKNISTYSLKNKALRIQAEILQYTGHPFKEIEKKYYDSIRLVIENEYINSHINSNDIAIVPPNELSSNNLTNSLLDLSSFYSQTKNKKYTSKALNILLAELRSLDNEFSILDSQFNSNDIFRKNSKVLSNKSEKRLMELRFEKIPLLNMQISEILWFEKNYDKSIEFAKESAQISSMYANMNFNSAKIAKMGFMNLSTMFQQLGDKEGSELCLKRSEEISIPMDAFANLSGSVRDVVLEYWFGAWGKFLFPG